MTRADPRSRRAQRPRGTPRPGWRHFPTRVRRRALASASALALAVAATPAHGQAWRVVPSVALSETLTSNVSLAPSNQAQGDLVTQLTPSLVFTEVGARTKLSGSVSVPILLYARTGGENNDVFPSANILGSVEAIDRFFFVEGAVSVSQPFISPFGAQPLSLTSATDNRYTQTTYRISPYVKSESPGGIHYELRNNSYWTNLSGAPISTSNSYTSEWLGTIDSPVAPLGWTADFDLNDVKFNNQGSQRTNLARAGPRYLFDSQIRLQATVGYEDNQFPLSSSSGAIYGGGIEWRPTERTRVSANAEHRFFGTSYDLTFDHRTPLSIWGLNASRNITSYPQQVGTLAAGTNVQTALDQLFSSRIPDPTARQQAVDDFIRSKGLPSELTGPVDLYTEQILLAENLSATVGLIGARNNVLMNVFRLRNEPITASGTLIPIDTGTNNTQVGANLVWTHSLTPTLSMNLSLYALRTEANAPQTGTTKQAAARLEFSAPISAHMSLTTGVRYQKLDSDITTSYTEAAVYAGVSYTLR